MIDSTRLLLISLVSLVLSLCITPLVRDAFLRLGMVDRPDGGRKMHIAPVPRIGGIPIAFSYVGAFAILLCVPGMQWSTISSEISLIIRILPAACLIFVTGLLDDVFDLRPAWKLSGQVLGGCLAVGAGLRISSVAGYALPDPLGILATIMWLTFCANAFNLIDGLDGLASGIGLFAAVTMLAAALLHGNGALILATAPLVGALLGFLRYNFNPASVFMGDSGSLLVGFLLGCYGIQWSQKSTTLLGMTAPAMAMAIPLADASLAILRRWLRGKPIFSGDRNHIHHRLLARGLTHRNVVLLLYSVGCIFAVLSVTGAVAGKHWSGAALVVFCSLLALGVGRLGYFEFTIARKVIFGGALSNAVQGRIALHGMANQLEHATSVDETFSILCAMAAEFGFSGVEARFRGRTFSNQLSPQIKEQCWSIRLPVSPDGDVTFFRSYQSPPVHGVMMAIVETLVASGPRIGRLPFETPHSEITSLLGLATVMNASPTNVRGTVQSSGAVQGSG